MPRQLIQFAQSHREDDAPILVRNAASRPPVMNDFINQRFKLTDIDDLSRFVGFHCADRAEFLPLFAALGSKPIGAFESFAALYTSIHGSAGEPSSKCVRVARDLLLLGVDRRLQQIYRNQFLADPPKPRTSHEQKIAALQTTRGNVSAVLNSYDWHWLADWLGPGGKGEKAESYLWRLANFAFPIHRVFLLFTRHCNISCRTAITIQVRTKKRSAYHSTECWQSSRKCQAPALLAST
jgi:hypothetical protein